MYVGVRERILKAGSFSGIELCLPALAAEHLYLLSHLNSLISFFFLMGLSELAETGEKLVLELQSVWAQRRFVFVCEWDAGATVWDVWVLSSLYRNSSRRYCCYDWVAQSPQISTGTSSCSHATWGTKGMLPVPHVLRRVTGKIGPIKTINPDNSWVGGAKSRDLWGRHRQLHKGFFSNSFVWSLEFLCLPGRDTITGV